MQVDTAMPRNFENISQNNAKTATTYISMHAPLLFHHFTPLRSSVLETPPICVRSAPETLTPTLTLAKLPSLMGAYAW